MSVSLDPQIAEVLESLVGAMARQVIALHQTAQRVGNFNIDQVRGVQALLHGHTHVPRDEMVGRVRWLNPGCITRPRGVPPTFAWLTVERGQALRWELVRV